MKRSTRDRWWVGIPLIAIGALILLRQLGYDIDIGYLFRTYWPVFLIWWGVKGLTEIRRNGGYAAIGPVVVLSIGGFFLARNLGVIGYSLGEFIRYLIPILLIGGGLYVLMGQVIETGSIMRMEARHRLRRLSTPTSHCPLRIWKCPLHSMKSLRKHLVNLSRNQPLLSINPFIRKRAESEKDSEKFGQSHKKYDSYSDDQKFGGFGHNNSHNYQYGYEEGYGKTQ